MQLGDSIRSCIDVSKIGFDGQINIYRESYDTTDIEDWDKNR